MSVPEKIEFNRPAKFTYIRTLGNGACGETIHVRDEDMACEFVVKKYKPIISVEDDPEFFAELLERFRDEARLLFRLHHRNIVRVFNFFDYREHRTSYIVMEYISARNIIEYLGENPAAADRIFEGVVDGFTHLQEKGILHRDIRPDNILVETTGTPKIIDFGFGKQTDIEIDTEEEKSISLNLWCAAPPEFREQIYDFKTEVYFVGKLFQKAVEDCGLSDFKYRSLLPKLYADDRRERFASFSEIQSMIMGNKFEELSFSNSDISTYRKFADELLSAIFSLRADVKFERDSTKVLRGLEQLHRRTMLAWIIHDTCMIGRETMFCARVP
jgi:serine/threonine-protein kinase